MEDIRHAAAPEFVFVNMAPADLAYVRCPPETNFDEGLVILPATVGFSEGLKEAPVSERRAVGSSAAEMVFKKTAPATSHMEVVRPMK